MLFLLAEIFIALLVSIYAHVLKHPVLLKLAVFVLKALLSKNYLAGGGFICFTAFVIKYYWLCGRQFIILDHYLIHHCFVIEL